MKIHSNKLYRYLRFTGALNREKKDIILAKANYRKAYKKHWKRNQVKNRKEVRFYLEKQELRKLSQLCKREHTTPTVLARELLLAYCSDGFFIPQKDKLLLVHRELGLLINKTDQTETRAKLLELERYLDSYLNDSNFN